MKRIWDEWKSVLLGATFGAMSIVLLGFLVFGWIPGGTSRQAGDTQADAAVVTAFAQICAAQFNSAPGAAANLETLKAMPSHSQGGYIENGGWATMPGSDQPAAGVAKECANVLTSP
jgi:hypothetical protein